jgi:hypothetical protein
MMYYILFCAMINYLYHIMLNMFVSNLNFSPELNAFLIIAFIFLCLVYSAFLILILFKDITQYCILPIIIFSFLFLFMNEKIDFFIF